MVDCQDFNWDLTGDFGVMISKNGWRDRRLKRTSLALKGGTNVYPSRYERCGKLRNGKFNATGASASSAVSTFPRA